MLCLLCKVFVKFYQHYNCEPKLCSNMERRNLPRKARDIKRDESDEDYFESPLVKKKPAKKQNEKSEATKNLVPKNSKRKEIIEDVEDRLTVPKKRGKTQSVELLATEEKIDGVQLIKKRKAQKTKLVVGKEDTDAPKLQKKKKLSSKGKDEVPTKELHVDTTESGIPALKNKTKSTHGKDEVPLKVLNVATPKNDIAALAKIKVASRGKKEIDSKQTDVLVEGTDISNSKGKKMASKSKKESSQVELDYSAAKKPSKGNIGNIPEKSDTVVLDSEISATKKKKLPFKGKSDIVQEEQQIISEKGSKKLQNSTETNYAKIDFNITEAFNTKICSFNVAGVRAFTKKGGQEYFKKELPDIICLQVNIELIQ